jgi:outer membrane biosynthesis protein TonB
MIPRLLVPIGAKPPAADVPTTRRRPSTLDERTLVPATLPIIPLDGRTNIPSSLPLEAIAARVVVPRDVKREEFVAEERAISDLPLQPTEMDERITVPQGAAPPEVIAPLEGIPSELVEADIFMTGEVNLLTKEPSPEKNRTEMIRSISSFVFHVAFIALIILEPKIFPPHVPTQAELDLARRQITILLPPGALDAPKTTPRPKEPTVKVDPRVLRRVAPTPVPEPTPPPAPKQPERVVKDLPAAPVPKPNVAPPQQQDPVAKTDAPKQPLKLEAPQQPTEHALLLPKDSLGRSLQDSIREAAKMNAPAAVGGGGQIPNNSGIPGGGGQGAAYGAMEMLTPTEGVDFSNYLQRVYVTVKRNWFAVMPESVRLGDKGVVSLQFRIMRNGGVPDGEPVRVFGSGKEPLDRAAISSIRASNPFEPLPSAFSGPFIELRFTYYYNVQPDYAH